MAGNPLRIDGEDSSLFVVPRDGDSKHLQAIEQQLSSDDQTPVPSDGSARGGPAPRVTDRFASIPASFLRRLIMSGSEAADAIRTRRDELYRNEFPLIRPRFEVACAACGAEFDRDVDSCPDCGSEDLRKPDASEKREALQLFESVNPAGQSLRDLAKRCEEDQWTVGVSAIVLEHEYYQATTGELYEEGEIYRAEPTALHRADPLSLRPVVDEDGQPGGYWWVCPIHRDQRHDDARRCPECNAECREVHFVEQTPSGDRYYLRDEVITWAYPHPRLHGLDGLAPSAHIWLKQAILQMMDRYGAAFYDPEADRLPNQFMILHTTNPDHWEEELQKARDEDDEYDSPIFTNQYSPQDNSQPEVQVIDAMPDELLGQNADLKSQYKSDIRQAYGISDIHDSDLEDAGGLNNEGLQLEVVDRSLASQMHDYRRGWLDTLMKRLSFGDWQIEFIPDAGVDAQELQRNLRTAAFVQQSGGQATIRDGDLYVEDYEVDLDDSDDPPALKGAPNLPGVGSPIPGEGDGGGGDPRAELATLEQALLAFQTAGAIESKGQPVYQERDDVPPNVQNRIKRAVRTHDFRPVESVSTVRLKDIFKERLTQPQGWSVDSLARHLRQEADVERERAEMIARTEATAIINRAREDAIADLAENVEEEVLHYWDGPDDESTSEICTWLKEQTNPAYGGDPVPMSELRDLQREAVDRFAEDDPGSTTSIRDHLLHPNERHTHRSVLASELE